MNVAVDGGSATPRKGRPRASEAGDVATRILDAAHELFLESGYARVTYDQIAAHAHTSKTTLYGRYPAKHDLFAAVVARSTAQLTEEIAAHGRSTLPRRDELVALGIALANATLSEQSIALMRVTAAEANTLPAVAREGFRIGFGACARAMAVGFAESDTAEAIDAAMPLARRFVELALHPLYMHAFFGADLTSLRKRSVHDVSEVIDHLLNTL